ncbi:MAG: PEP-CTERM sorting domain-containing protein [Pseudomonadales bacterium]|nr:hypothetical protein [Pseudomonadales bacterium]MCP5330035.1 PEP-CTERM sorting domain-containing protein [Pseudomonadales bacterium]MCP5343056.1 PEP-CTERM sorting domain-containing protein [Pseudomonadales bacterium]
MRTPSLIATALLLALNCGTAFAQTHLLFIGNSFTFGSGSPARFYRADTVTDLNKQGIGGVPALFKSFTDQAGLDYDVSLETQPGSGLDFHLANRLEQIGSYPWDTVVMHGYSTLDRDNPGSPELLVSTARQMGEVLRGLNPQVQIYLTATWARADQTYPAGMPWHGKTLARMAQDIRAGYDQAASASGARAVNPVGDAWNRAMETGIADANPYDGIGAEQMNLWTYDHYHASHYGYYLEALVVFGSVTGLDPRVLGSGECSAYELGLSRPQAAALQQVAYEQLAAEGRLQAAPESTWNPASPQACR